MNRCSVCHELLPGLTQGMCSECRNLTEAGLEILSGDEALTALKSMFTPSRETVLQSQQQLHQQRLNQLSSFPLGQSSAPTSQESSNGED